MKDLLQELLGKKTRVVISDVPSDLRHEIFNVIGDKYLTNLLFALKKYGFIDYSSNPINTFEEEKELKILNIPFAEVQEKLVTLWAKKVFEGDIEDIYYDYPDFRFDSGNEKISFRIRRKVSEDGKEAYYYTIKRKRGEETLKNGLRVCYEKEFEIHHMGAFRDMLVDVLELIKLRRKQKRRVAYSLGWVKFDIDFYKWIPPLLEIEAAHSTEANEYIQKLGLENNETSLSGSRGLFERYGLKYEVFASKEMQENLKNL